MGEQDYNNVVAHITIPTWHSLQLPGPKPGTTNASLANSRIFPQP
jgi:hypothetical protein